MYNRDAPVTLQVRAGIAGSCLRCVGQSYQDINLPTPVWCTPFRHGCDLCVFLSPQTEASHFFGYVYFRQVKDVSVKRGYFQKVSHTCPHLSTPVYVHSRRHLAKPACIFTSCLHLLTPVSLRAPNQIPYWLTSVFM